MLIEFSKKIHRSNSTKLNEMKSASWEESNLLVEHESIRLEKASFSIFHTSQPCV